MARATPSPIKRRAGPKGHVPYNARPKEVGTRTGKAMPMNVPRGSDGFEDVNAFFESPAVGLTSTVRTVRTRREFDTPGASAFITPSHTGKRGRMAALLGSDDDEEDGSGLGKGLLDEDDVLEPHLSSPNLPYFSGSNPPNVPFPRRSKATTASPAVGFDDLPTPKGRNGRQSTMSGASPGMALTSRRKTSEAASPNIGDASFGVGDNYGDMGDYNPIELDVNDAMVNAAIEDDEAPVRTKSKRSTQEARADEEEEEEEVEQHMADADDAASDASDGGGGGGFEVDDGGEGMSLEEAAIAHENGDGDSVQHSDEDRRPLKKGGAKKRARKETGPARSRTPQTVREPKHKRVSKFGVAEEEGYEGDFICRRSKRNHFAPLKYWLGEHFEYTRGQYQPVITEVVHVPEVPVESLGAKKKQRRARSRSAKPTRDDSSEPVGRFGIEDGWDADTEPYGLVQDFVSQKEQQRRIAYPRHRLEPQPVAGGTFKYQKVFGEDLFIAGGVLYVPVGGMKPGKFSKDNAYIFYVIAGAVEVTIHRTEFVIAAGGMFFVPRGNHYQITNISEETEAELFFSQSRKIQVSEGDQAALSRIASERGSNEEDGAGDEITIKTPKAKKPKQMRKSKSKA
ncbi:Mif2/CENP-C like-domain-containing protein [Kockovaella imperatae]|uniref:CENP-C homolog n=1 Tax=Kockovaella imperatae TaxID=4999 RepID=A0A1Y1UBB5_9TREE|nr:Mif2/CENP-C like-domain-containing protein [Kockovaella imperatae]ORX35333.1 Mif2/CENP-C like-domain-containing protein [Kockovaella imperatae]